MTIKEAAREAPRPASHRKPGKTDKASMAPASSPDRGDRPIVAINSIKMLGLVGSVLAVLASIVGALVVHAWEDIDRHLDKIDGQLASLEVTQGKFEQFLTAQLPGISQDLRRNTDLMFKLESNVSVLSQSVAQVQRQVTVASEQVEKLKDDPKKGP